MSASLDKRLSAIDTLTFDCYGTLIDWRAGIESSLLAVFGDGLTPHLPALFEHYVEAEKTVEAADFRSYRDVITDTVLALGKRLGLSVDREQASRMPDMVGSWLPFSDTVAGLQRLKSRYRLGVLSNIDRDLFAQTQRSLGIEFDFLVTAEDVRAYKPSHDHFKRMMSDHAKRDAVLHVAQSLFHDGVPARDLDLAYVWINRYNDVNDTDVAPAAEFPDLVSLAGFLGV